MAHNLSVPIQLPPYKFSSPLGRGREWAAGGGSSTLMKQTTKRTIRRICDIVITILTALLTVFTAQSCR